jgi:FAD/FMN-containing dehydrogenase
MVIDLSLMKGVFLDPVQRTVRVQGGATLGDVDRETHLHGLAVPMGVVSRTGIGGLTLGGGGGWLVRKHGLTCDNLLSCEVVTAAGEVITASEEHNADLFWGLRGGGGNFGIVTSFLFRAHPVSTVLGGFIFYARDQAHGVLRHYRSYMAGAPEELTAFAALLSMPDGTPVTAMVACYCGDAAEGERVLKPLRTFGSPLLDAIQSMPLPAMQQLIDAGNPGGTYNYWRSTFLRELSDDALDLIIDHANRMESPMSGTIFELYGGAVGRVGSSDTAFAPRQAEYNIQMAAQWRDAAESAKHIAWARGLSDALKPYSSGHYLMNYLNDETPDVVRRAFGSNYPRLVELKTKYDPTNFFSLNQNVQPLR